MTSVFCVRGCHFGRKPCDPRHPRVCIKPSKLSITLLLSSASILGRDGLQISGTSSSWVHPRPRHPQKLGISTWNAFPFRVPPEDLMHPLGKYCSRCQDSLEIKEAFMLWVALAASHNPFGAPALPLRCLQRVLCPSLV